MSVPAGHGRNAPADLGSFDYGSARSLDTLDAGEPIHPPRQRGSSMLSASLVLLLLFGGGWTVMQAPADWLERLGAKTAELATLLRGPEYGAAVSDASSIATADQPGAAETGVTPIAPMIEQADNVATDAATPPDSEPVDTGSISTSERDEPQPLPPPRVDPADPYQRRAAEAGLHPELSRVLLARLSATDYRNARYAIDTAVAKTADEALFVWPRQRKPEQALFRVHFVAGAAAQCRRYVVTVVKDGWSTTALPMERCGAQLAGRKASGSGEKAVVTGH